MGNSLGEDITGKHGVVKQEAFSPAYGDIKYRVFLVSGGFGASNLRGTAVLGTTPFDGESFRIDGHDIERYATDDEIKAVTP